MLGASKANTWLHFGLSDKRLLSAGYLHIGKLDIVKTKIPVRFCNLAKNSSEGNGKFIEEVYLISLSYSCTKKDE